jgi:hypothetical protein
MAWTCFYRDACQTLLALALVAPVCLAVEKPPGKLHETTVKARQQPRVLAAGYKLWLPKDVSAVRCVIAVNQRGAGKRLFRDEAWRALAARLDAGLMFCGFEAYEVTKNGAGRSMMRALDQFAAQLKRPELKHAPLVLWGHSMGGRVAQDFTRWQPNRVAAFVIALRAYKSDAEFMKEPAAAMKVPGLYLMGEADKKPRDIRDHFRRARAAGSPRTWVWLPGQGHWPKGMGFKQDQTSEQDWRAWSATDVVIPWVEAVVAKRLPKDADPRRGPVKLREIDAKQGWLGDIESKRIAPWRSFRGDRAQASWFPNEKVGKAWQKYSASGGR